jgi:quercetin dioxygenase-like cupin family protein
MHGEPRVVWMPGGVRTEIHLGAEDTGGAFCLLVDAPPAGWSLPAHRHATEAETIHVLAGEFELTVEGVVSRLSAGQTAHVPAGARHSGGNVGTTPGRRLVLFSPAGLERFFLVVGASDPGADVDVAAVLAAAARFGWDFGAA